MKIILAHETIELLPEKAFLWKKERLLGLSDIHIGKIESLQAAGIPLPSGAHHQDLDVISDLIHRHKIEQVHILGDFIHQKESWSKELLKDLEIFFAEHSHVDWNLLIGNHERGSRDILGTFPFTLHEEEFKMGPFVFTHGHKVTKNSLFEIRGHLHPLIHLQEGPLRMKLPCFWLEKNRMTLPSFGSLTGGHPIKAKATDRVFAVAGQEIFEVR